MTAREERLAKNEATSRDINEGIKLAHDEGARDKQVRMVCECGHAECERLVAITLSEYEEVRGDPVQFVVIREHVIDEVERVVRETDRFVVVAKRNGVPADIAVEEDPRS